MTIDELRAKFVEWMKSREGYPFAGQFVNTMWTAYQAAHASRDAEVGALRRELSASISKVDRLVDILVGINNLLYPPKMSVNGKEYVFNPPIGDANAWVRELSDRIRAIPSKIDAAIREGE